MFKRLTLAALSVALFLPSGQAKMMNSPQSQTTLLEKAGDFVLPVGAQWQGGAIQPSGGQSVTITGKVSGLRPFDELIPSWNVTGGSVTLEVRPAGSQRYFSFGEWSVGKRSSVNGQADGVAQMLTDTLRLKAPATSFEYRLILRSGAALKLLAFNTSSRSARLQGLGKPGSSALWGKVLDVPQRSQMIYPQGGEVWCSPTSTSMILAYYGINHSVPDTAHAIYDSAYDGTGNWAFNAAYAGSQGLRAYVTRLGSLSEAESYIAAGKPLGVSLGWKKGELPGAPIQYSDGHLMVLVGFDKQGNPVLNDPAAPSNATVRHTYPRAAFEKLWLSHSGGVAYVMERRG